MKFCVKDIMVKNLAIKCRGLPFSCTEGDLRGFLGDSGIESVNLPTREGKATGEATVTYNNDRDYNEALKKDHEYMGHRWIEVFPADEDGSKRPRGGRDKAPDRGERVDRPKFSGPEERFGRYGESCIRIRGLPYSASDRDVYEFFRGIPILPEGVLMGDDPKKGNGEAFVVFEDERGARSAKALHMKSMGRRYIEIFDASYTEMIRFCQDNRLRVPRPPPPGGIPGYGYDSPFAPAQGGYQDRRGPVTGPLSFGGYQPPGAPPEPYYGDSGPGYPSRPAADPYARADAYSAPRDEPYGRPALPFTSADPYRREDPYARRGYGDAYGDRPGYPPVAPPPAADPYSRPGDAWRDDRPAPPSAGYGLAPAAMEGYGYGEYAPSAGGGPMKREAAVPAWRAAEYDRPMAEAPRGRERPGQRYVLKMRGVPFRAVETDVYEFFEPIRPSRVEIVREPGGRPSGEARVEFESRKDYDEALLKDKQYMGQRYVELFPDFGGRY